MLQTGGVYLYLCICLCVHVSVSMSVFRWLRFLSQFLDVSVPASTSTFREQCADSCMGRVYVEQAALLERERQSVAERERSVALMKSVEDLRALKAHLERDGPAKVMADAKRRSEEEEAARLAAWERQLDAKVELLRSEEERQLRVSATVITRAA